MARTVKENEYTARRNEILDVAQRLVYTKGYEQMSVQDILVDLQISKGAFYHYFDSKQGMIEALIERIMLEAEQILIPIVQDPHLPAIEKFLRFFDKIAQWKVERKSFFLALLRVWYSDDNALMRLKVRDAGLKWYTPMLTEIIQQGIRENTFTTPYPDQVGEVTLSLMLSLGNSIGELFIPEVLNPDSLRRISSIIAAYTDALERILGAPTGSLHLIDDEILREWVTP